MTSLSLRMSSAVAVAAVLAAAAATGCSPGKRAPAPVAATAGRAVTDPATVTQVKDKLLAPGMAPGFLPLPRNVQSASKSAAGPFRPPAGGPARACSRLMSPGLFRPPGLLGSGQTIAVADPRRSAVLKPSWFEWIDVYPGTEAAGIIRTLPRLLSKCGHFPFHRNGGAGAASGSETATPLAGLGDQALYVMVRVHGATPNRFAAFDWIVIRSSHTLIWIGDQGSLATSPVRDPLTMRLAGDAWRHYAA